jgi:frataxin-like iron-binding protein CyaY
MKFFKYNNNRCKIINNKLTAIYSFNHKAYHIQFYKNGERHNSKNAAYIDYNGYKEFWLNSKKYGYEYDFTKQSWRRFVKLQFFL